MRILTCKINVPVGSLRIKAEIIDISYKMIKWIKEGYKL
jgi:hypothetical protein